MDPGLDFASLLGIAEHVSKGKASSGVQLLKTKFSGPKKEKREKGKLNVNVKRFLEKKEAEEKAKEKEKKLQLKNLQGLRTDSAKNKIAKHLKVTKSANKAVISEAVNKRDTADTMHGRKQCDEDDYGFESNVSNTLYEKLMGKYESCPDDPMSKFSKAKPKTHVDISSAKERVKMALRQEEEPQPRKRKRKHGGEGEVASRADEDGISYKREARAEERPVEQDRREDRREDKGRREREKMEASQRRKEMSKKVAKPLDFQSLLEIANTVKDKPVQLNKPKEVKEFEIGGRPMTKKQREEYLRENESRLRREGKLPPKETAPPPLSSKKNGHIMKDDRPKSEDRSVPKIPKVRRPEPGPELHAAVKKSLPPPSKKPAEVRKPENGRKDDRKLGEGKTEETAKMQEKFRKMQEKCKEMEERLKIQEEHRKLQEKMKDMEAKLAKVPSSSSSSSSKPTPSSSKTSSKSSDDRKRDIRDVPARQFPGEKVRKQDKDKPRRAGRIESDSEYDSEMDDFIDNTESNFDISKEIRSIFGYDRNRYRDEPEFDDRSMENNRYSSIMQEEMRSARIGRMEDLEDMRREEDEKKRKVKKMKGGR